MRISKKKGVKAPKIKSKDSKGMTVAQVIHCMLQAFKEQSDVIASIELKLAVLEARVGLYYEIQKNTYEMVKELRPKSATDKPSWGVVKPKIAKGNQSLRSSLVIRKKSTQPKPASVPLLMRSVKLKLKPKAKR